MQYWNAPWRWLVMWFLTTTAGRMTMPSSFSGPWFVEVGMAHVMVTTMSPERIHAQGSATWAAHVALVRSASVKARSY
jgi:hypothetical protein